MDSSEGDSQLDPIQERILLALTEIQPPWVLTGGAALAGFHLKHRRTRDLDLFWRNRSDLAELPRILEGKLRAVGLEIDSIQTAPTFHRFRVSDGTTTCILDLVADSTPAIEAPQSAPLGDQHIAVDTPHEILVNKLCTLLSRSELRDLQDVKALVDSGEDLYRALEDAPKKDAGFSPLTLAWILRGLNVEPLAAALGWLEADTADICHFREWLVETLASAARPGNEDDV